IARGVTTPNIDTAYVKTKLVELGAEVILLIDSTKIEKANFVRFADLAQIDILITDEHANSEYVEKIEEKDVLVEIAK
ncbi:MAG: hypothetical protein RR777_06750, partial [Christensenellaceae bacterium]